MRIHFRSRFSHSPLSGKPGQKQKNIGNELDTIRPYHSQNDAKYIFWKKSTHTLVEKTFEETKNIAIITAIIHSSGDDEQFSPSTSRKQWKEHSEKLISESAISANIPYKNYIFSSLKICRDTLYKQHIKHHLIFLFCNHSNTSQLLSLKKLSGMNEVIYIHGYDPFELHPNNTILMEGKIFHEKYYNEYRKELKNEEKRMEKILKKMKISPIFTNTSLSIDATLNHFFKYTYAKK